MTERQLEFIKVLLVERVVPDDGPFDALLDEIRVGGEVVVSRVRASEIISYLMDLAKADKPRQKSVRPGVYRTPEGDVVRVKRIPMTRDTFTQVLRSGRYVDAPDALFQLEPDMRMRARAAAGFIRETGVCPWCSRAAAPARNPLQGVETSCARKLV